MVSGLPSEARFQLLGMPFSLAMVSSDIALTSDETPIMVNIKKAAQAMIRDAEQMWCLSNFCLVFLDTISFTF